MHGIHFPEEYRQLPDKYFIHSGPLEKLFCGGIIKKFGVEKLELNSFEYSNYDRPPQLIHVNKTILDYVT